MLSVSPKGGPDGYLQLHASTVVLDGQAIALTGPAGSGKSSMSLCLIGKGAQLLADDITWFERTADGIIAHCPPTLSGRIEARGVGILKADPAQPAPLRLIVDLGIAEPDRLPYPKTVTLMGHDICVLHTPETAHFIDAIVHYIRHGRAE